ncbi:hypothetical protein ACP70R_024476 [Stipagrostis hirtigluma subsp. patula]
MEARPSRIECPVAPEQPEPRDPGRLFDFEPVAPRDAAESAAEKLARGGVEPRGVVDETYDTKVKIGEALEASAREIGDQPVEAPDAAAIRAAEACAVRDAGVTAIPGGVADVARAAADANARAARPEDKVTFRDVLTWETTMKLPTDKAVTSEVAATVTAAEEEAAGDTAGEATRPHGVSVALKRAAIHNCDHWSAS